MIVDLQKFNSDLRKDTPYLTGEPSDYLLALWCPSDSES